MNVIKAKVTKFSYEPEIVTQNLLAYRVTAELIDNDVPPRIGLRGTAKIFGEEVKLFFFLFRKPLFLSDRHLALNDYAFNTSKLTTSSRYTYGRWVTIVVTLR